MRKNKKAYALVLAMCLLGSNSVYAAELNLKVDGISYSTQDYITQEGTAYYKVQTICDILGVKTARSTNTMLGQDEITFTYLNDEVKVNLLTKEVTKNNIHKDTKYMPVEKNGELMLPVRFFEQMFDFTVAWDNQTNSILIGVNDEFDILEDTSRQGEDLTLEKAIEKVKTKSESLKKIEENIQDAEESIDKLELSYSSGLSLGQLESAQRSLEKLRINKTITESSLELQVNQMFINIKNAEKSLATTKYCLELAKKNLDIARQKYDLGMISTKDMEAQETSYNKNLENIDKQQKSINELYKTLNELMDEDKNKQYHLVFETDYTPLTESFDIDTYVEKALEENLSLKAENLSVEDAEDVVSYYWAGTNATYDKYLDEKENLEDAKKAYTESKNNLEDKIKDTYEDLLDYEKDYTTAQKDLADAIEDYEILKLKYNLGQATKLQLESEKLNVVKAQIEIQQLIYSYNTLLYKFNHTELLSSK